MKFLTDKAARADREAESADGRTVVVGVKLDAGIRELLTWVLVNVAQCGDRVIVLHVIRSSAGNSIVESSSFISVEKELNAVLAAYEGFCNLKQIDLELKISWGSSIRRVLAQETISVSASKLIVGISKNTQGLNYYSVTIAKYCAKKVSGGCLVLGVNNGNIVYQKEAAGNSKEDEVFFGSEFLGSCKINGRTGKAADESARRCLPSASMSRLSCDRLYSYAANLSSRFYLVKNENFPAQDSVFEPLCSPSSDGNFHTLSESGKGSSGAVSMKNHEHIRESDQRRRGWPLFRWAFLSRNKSSSRGNQKDASVVQLTLKHPFQHSVSNFDCNGVVESTSPVISKELLSLREKYSSICRLFSLKELEQATSNFSSENIIGKGGSSRVYKGRLTDNRELAVKILVPSDDLLRNFITEIEIMSNLFHKNIISLTGFCFENDYHILIYDFLSRGSLEDNLHGLCWDKRYKIAVGVAEALEYLHDNSSTEPVIIHRDVKSSNILLSDDFEPRLSDFGLAQLASSSLQNTCTDLEGTFGYLAPECFTYGKIDEKVDVYAFGVVLLELLSGRKPVCSDCPKGEESLVLWVINVFNYTFFGIYTYLNPEAQLRSEAKPNLRDWKLKHVLDSSLGENFNTDEMERMCLAAFLCIRRAPRHRPNIARIMKLLKGDDEAVKWANVELRASMAPDDIDDESTTKYSNIQSHINLALLGIHEDDDLSVSSRAHSFGLATSETSLEEYWKEMSSFN
ncbi:Receptor-like serine/threonine-protein kinase ALE2 [Platanthera zijinensis]|uniref:Receptor-like serine/threonine-protein kinase ALE2 n=1 Tax=Platanthera zijinensis TaxID=2320716 RepID=A0AAP0GAS2_9ASPA